MSKAWEHFLDLSQWVKWAILIGKFVNYLRSLIIQAFQSDLFNLAIQDVLDDSLSVFIFNGSLFSLLCAIFATVWFVDWDNLCEFFHPASEWRLAKAFKTAPRDDIMKHECLRLHGLVYTRSTII